MLALVQVLLQGIRGVDWSVLFRGIFAGVLEDDLGSAGVLREELGDIVGTAVDNDPA